MGKIADAITGLFNSEKVTITDSGQKVIALEPILEEVKGLDIIDVDTGESDLVDDVTDTTELPEYASYQSYTDLMNLVTALETRLVKLESAIEIADNLTGEKETEVEVW